MAGTRTISALVGLVLSLAVSAGAWYYFDTFLLFLFLPFIPIWFWRQTPDSPRKQCPTCGFQAHDPEVNYCPRDGTKLVDETGGEPPGR